MSQDVIFVAGAVGKPGKSVDTWLVCHSLYSDMYSIVEQPGVPFPHSGKTVKLPVKDLNWLPLEFFPEWKEKLSQKEKNLFGQLGFGFPSKGTLEDGTPYTWRMTNLLNQRQIGLLLGVGSLSELIWTGSLPVAQALIQSHQERSWLFGAKYRLNLPSRVEAGDCDCWTSESLGDLSTKTLRLVVNCALI